MMLILLSHNFDPKGKKSILYNNPSHSRILIGSRL